MQRYIEQIIQDLADSKKKIPPEPIFSEIYEVFEEQMLAIENAPDIAMEKLFGISQIHLPPFERLSESQIQQLIEAILDSWDAYGLYAEFPDRVPLKIRYKLLREKFGEKVKYTPGFNHHFDFCCGECKSCEIAEYCDIKDDIEKDDELPDLDLGWQDSI